MNAAKILATGTGNKSSDMLGYLRHVGIDHVLHHKLHLKLSKMRLNHAKIVPAVYAGK